MKSLLAFFDAVASPGGNLVLLAIFVVLSGVAMNKVHYSDQIDTVMISVFSAFSGALLQALTGRVLQKKEEPTSPAPPTPPVAK